MWLHLFNFINYFGVVTNAFLIAFTSKFGSLYLRSRISKFMFIVAFEVSESPMIHHGIRVDAQTPEYCHRNPESQPRLLSHSVEFQHLVFVVKYLLTLLIPDVPEAVKGAKARVSYSSAK